MTRPGWLTDAEAVEKYGLAMLKKMGKTGYLDCVTGIGRAALDRQLKQGDGT